MVKLKGNNLVFMVKRDGVEQALAYGTSCELNIEADTVEVSGKDSGRWPKLKKKKFRWEGSSAHIMAADGVDANYIISLVTSTKSVAVYIKTVEEHRDKIAPSEYVADGKFAFKGNAMVTKATITGNRGSAVSLSMEFKGSGKAVTDQDEELPDDDGDDEGGGGGDGGNLTLGDLLNVIAGVDEVPADDRVLWQESGSSLWTWKKASEIMPDIDKIKQQLYSTFLRKDVDDTAHGVITFEKGAIFGSEYIEGMKGGKIDENGNAHLRSLSVDTFVEAPEFRYNRISITVGNKWRAPGGGLILSAVPDTDTDGNELMTGTCQLKLEDGDIGTIAVDDICMGIYHDGLTLDIAESQAQFLDDYGRFDDGKGNFLFNGFYTAYFRITEILDEQNSMFRYAMRPVSDSWNYTKHPCSIMVFVCYGNFADTTRQSSKYETLTYERYLAGVNDWEFSGSNVAMQLGDLGNLCLFGINMEGYSAYLNNIYMSGTINQTGANYPLRLELATDGDNFLSYGEVLHVTCSVFQGWDERTSEVTQWKVARDTGDAAADAAWALRNKVKAFDGELDITLSADPDENDLGENENCISTLFTFKAIIGEGSSKEESTATLEI